MTGTILAELVLKYNIKKIEVRTGIDDKVPYYMK